MVLGIEVSDVFDCKVTRIPGLFGMTLVDKNHCNEASIFSGLELLYGAGVRQINLVHEFNNALGGNGIFDGGEEALNALYSSAEDYIRAWEKVENR